MISTMTTYNVLVQLDSATGYKGPFRVRNTDKASKLHDWVLQTPRAIWELGASDLPLTEVRLVVLNLLPHTLVPRLITLSHNNQTILRLLLRLIQRHLLPPSTYSSLRARLAPYFSIAHPTRGRLAGPWSKLPTQALRRLALDVVSTLGEGEADSAVEEAVRGTEDAGYWTAVRAGARYARARA